MKGLSDEDRRCALKDLKEAREALLNAADQMDQQLTDARLGLHH